MSLHNTFFNAATACLFLLILTDFQSWSYWRLEQNRTFAVRCPIFIIEPSQGPGRASELNLTSGQLNELLPAASPLRGFQTKARMLNPEEWLPEFELTRNRTTNQWLQSAKDGWWACSISRPQEPQDACVCEPQIQVFLD